MMGAGKASRSRLGTDQRQVNGGSVCTEGKRKRPEAGPTVGGPPAVGS